MKLFNNGIATFSPLVSLEVKNVWRSHGGIVTDDESPEETRLAQWFFCNGLEDPSLARVLSRDVVVFHADWVLASAANGFPLPLAEYVLDEIERFGGLYARNNSCKENLGSSLVGIYRALPEINAQIDNSSRTNYSVPTRLAAISESRSFRKRPYASSPGPWHMQKDRLIKKTKLDPLEDSTTDLESSGSRSTPILQEIARAYDETPTALVRNDFDKPSDMLEIDSSTDSFPLRSALLISKGREAIRYSGTRESRIPKLSNFVDNKAEHDVFRLCEKLVHNGQVQNVMGCSADSLSSVSGTASQLQLLSKNPVGSGSGPDYSGAESAVPRGSSKKFWLPFVQNQNPTGKRTDADCDVPIFRISDTLTALRKLDANSASDGNNDILVFVKGLVREGRKFDVDVDKTDRRKTI